MYKRYYLALILSLSLTALILISVKADKPNDPESASYSGYTPQDFVVPLPKNYKKPTPTPTPKPNKTVLYYNSVIKGCYLDEIPLQVVELELEPLGYYFITAYCPAECGGSWQTASGETCYRASHANRYIEPTTCAVDPNLHSIGSEGDLFFISEFDRVFIATDTGGAVKGKHLDLFYEEYYDVLSFPTGYYQAYSVSYNYYLVPACNYDVREIIKTALIDKLSKTGL